jgi:hypothetical protein
MLIIVRRIDSIGMALPASKEHQQSAASKGLPLREGCVDLFSGMGAQKAATIMDEAARYLPTLRSAWKAIVGIIWRRPAST